MNPTTFILVCSVLFFGFDDPFCNTGCRMGGILPGTHWLMQAADMQEEGWMEDLGCQDPLELKATHHIYSYKSHPGYAIKLLPGLVTSRISGLDLVLLDRPPPNPGLLLK